jgi:uncharacterized membrane protein
VTEQRDMSEEPANEAAKAAKLVYVLYLFSPLTGGITLLIGLVIAYLNRGDSPAWVGDHFTYQIRTFWIGLLYSLVAAVLVSVLIGWLVSLVVLVWFIVRCVKGYQRIDRDESPADVETWFF